MNAIDLVIVFAYLIGMATIGVVTSRKQTSISTYYVADNSVGMLTIMCLWVTYWVGGAMTIGSVQDSYELGISGATYPIVVAVGLVIFGLTFAEKLNLVGRKMRFITLPDMMEARYGSNTAVITAIIMIVVYIAYTAAQIVACSTVVMSLTNKSAVFCFVVPAAILIVYTALGGLMAVALTDWIQFGLLILGIYCIAFPVAVTKAGGFLEIGRSVPAEFLTLKGTSVSSLFAMLISTVLCFYTNMDSFTRCFSAKSPRAARNGTLLAALVTAVIGVITAVLGLASKVLLPTESSSNALIDTIFMFFPQGIRALILIGILAAAMDSGDICILTASANFTNDIYAKYICKTSSDAQKVKVGKMASLMVGVFSAALAWFIPNIIDTLFIGINVAAATLFFPVIFGMYWEKASGKATFISSLVSLLVVCIWSACSNAGLGGIFNIDSVYPGLLCSAILFFGISLLTEQTESELDRAKVFISSMKTVSE